MTPLGWPRGLSTTRTTKLARLISLIGPPSFRSLSLLPEVDPEIPINIYELGPDDADRCPAAQTLPADVEAKVRALPGVTDVKVEVVFDPPWESCMMSAAAKLQLGML
jgi:metal-sulfur cluster biosynthetic enzyme